MKRIILLFSVLNIIFTTGCMPTEDKTIQSQDELVKLDHKERDFTAESPKNFIQIDEQHITDEKPKKRDVKGIYLHRYSIMDKNINTFIDLIKSTNLNAVVIDVKDDFGKLTYDSNIEMVNENRADSNFTVKNMEKLVQRLKEEDIYTIARVVVFKDPHLAEQKNEFALKRKDGSLWENDTGVKWIDPYKKDVWKYVTTISQEVADFGFDEIQYDYVRFPENAKKVEQEVTYDNKAAIEKDDNISAFLKFSKEQLEQHPIYVSADVFGLVTTAEDDMGIGQTWEKISPHVDYISPMTYPSHYAPNSYGIDNPDQHPYDLMTNAMKDALQKNENLKTTGKMPAIIRPWIQDFDFKSDYTKTDVQNQIQALEEQGINQYLIWNASNEYTKLTFESL
ncbi:putative glycoside hydrolase [Virgibacillus byunsanensis]|uniref:Glycoside hydrolase n=1 Tax=Virgibacillus byunsanensis TaxID=570945 RepID=A0ABW3LU49_9BACI